MKQETHSRGFRGRFSVLTAGAACLAAALLTGCPTGTAYGPLSNSDLRLFQSRYVYGVSGEATDVAAADFNGDNIPDLAAINNDQQNVSVLLSEGAVKYVEAKDYDLGTRRAPWPWATPTATGGRTSWSATRPSAR